MTPIDPGPFGIYTSASVQDWHEIATRHETRDRFFFKSIAKHFVPGSVLDLGAACGQTSQRLTELGFEVTATDYHGWFVDYMRVRGLTAHIVDATDIQSALKETTFSNVFSQSLSPQVYKHTPEIVNKTYHSVHRALRPKGRYIAICPLYAYKNRELRHNYLTVEEHLSIIKDGGLFRVVTFFGHQVLPPALYRRWNGGFLNQVDFFLAKFLPNRVVFVLERVG